MERPVRTALVVWVATRLGVRHAISGEAWNWHHFLSPWARLVRGLRKWFWWRLLKSDRSI